MARKSCGTSQSNQIHQDLSIRKSSRQKNGDMQVNVCTAIRPYKKLWSLSHNGGTNGRGNLDAWSSVAAKTGLKVKMCKQAFQNAKSNLKRRICNAIANKNATTWQQIDNCVTKAPRSNWELPQVWIKLPWLAEEIAKDILLKKSNPPQFVGLVGVSPDHEQQYTLKHCVDEANSTLLALKGGESEHEKVPMSSGRKVRKSKEISNSSAKKRKHSAAKSKRNALPDTEFNVISAAAADRNHPTNVDGPTTMMDVKYSVVIQDESLNEQHKSWRSLGPPVTEEPIFVNSSAPEYFGSSQPSFASSQQFFGDQQSEQLSDEQLSYLNMLNRYYIMNLGNVPDNIVEAIIEAMKRYYSK